MTTPSPAGMVLCVLLSCTLSSDCRAWIPVSLQVISTCTLMMPGFLSPNEVVRHSTPTTHTHSQSLDQVITTHLLSLGFTWFFLLLPTISYLSCPLFNPNPNNSSTLLAHESSLKSTIVSLSILSQVLLSFCCQFSCHVSFFKSHFHLLGEGEHSQVLVYKMDVGGQRAGVGSLPPSYRPQAHI